MSRYRGPRVRIIRRLGALPGLTSCIPKKQHLPGKNQTLSKQLINQKKSQYSIRLEEKQKLIYHYGISEKQLLNYIKLARKTKGSTGQALLQLLEMRLDNIIFRLGMVPTIPGARQLVNHGHILVNDKRVNIPSYRCKPQDVIQTINRKNINSVVSHTWGKPVILPVSNHLIWDSDHNKALINGVIDRKWVGLQINELLVVEYYSRKT
nr:ribosomal protein S4 [Entransia fimbriata]WKT05762.1 ribosomal protein S4 [Entransia fimbriata]WKT05880.1 ribosomal protein S4 [Entransia fimbriata]WKT05881.1 ribosomal protein S4 [Entransia fimbriata]